MSSIIRVGHHCLLLILVLQASAAKWRWPEDNQHLQTLAKEQSVRIDTKVHFTDNSDKDKSQPYSDGTIDSVQYCKCTSSPDCPQSNAYVKACATGQYLCCYRRKNSESFNEIEDERMIYSDRDTRKQNPFLTMNADDDSNPYKPVRHGLHSDSVEAPDVLIGPSGPTGHVGPPQQILVGPDGPTGVIGPAVGINNERDTGPSASAQRGVLVGPGGPTGVIGPYYQRPIVYGQRGSTGFFGSGSSGSRSRGVLVGPGGPTGIIGPAFRQNQNRGILVGPGGPSGTIGPGRPILVGPGGPTGQIGPRRYYN